jgi:hypothetical protein
LLKHNDTSIYTTTSGIDQIPNRLKLFLILQHPLPSEQTLTFATFADPFDPRLVLYYTYTPSKGVSHIHSLFLATVDDDLRHTSQDLACRERLVSEVMRKIREVTSNSPDVRSESLKANKRLAAEAEKPPVQSLFQVSMKQDGRRVQVEQITMGVTVRKERA